ncbi:MAG: hypothetical protein ACTSWK_08365 [Promethearchaeota archaeon]
MNKPICKERSLKLPAFRKTIVATRTNDPKNPLPEILFGTGLGGFVGYGLSSKFNPENRDKWTALSAFLGSITGWLYHRNKMKKND